MCMSLMAFLSVLKRQTINITLSQPFHWYFDWHIYIYIYWQNANILSWVKANILFFLQYLVSVLRTTNNQKSNPLITSYSKKYKQKQISNGSFAVYLILKD